ncbi:MAG: phosphatase PAP2 family protein [Bacilli bacterium]|nr:phosphatase PAP2 family protein [Bacilli bacterium]
MKKEKLITLILLIILLLIDIILILTGIMNNIDSIVYDFIFSFNNTTLTNIFKIISLLASTKMVIIYNIIIVIVMIIRKSNKLVLVPIASSLSGFITYIIKIIVARERPGINPLVIENTYSFPSGHSMISILFFGTLLYIINRENYKYKKVFNIIIPIYILSVGISRIYLGVHYFSDCISGYLIAGIILVLLTIRREK